MTDFWLPTKFWQKFWDFFRPDVTHCRFKIDYVDLMLIFCAYPKRSFITVEKNCCYNLVKNCRFSPAEFGKVKFGNTDIIQLTSIL